MSQEPEDDDLVPEYDFSGAVRGKYYERYQQGTNVVLLDPDVARPSRTRSRSTVHSVSSLTWPGKRFPEPLTLQLRWRNDMDPHRLAEERSIAYHRVIAERLQRQPEVLTSARQRVQTWLASGTEAPFYARKWSEILAGDPLRSRRS